MDLKAICKLKLALLVAVILVGFAVCVAASGTQSVDVVSNQAGVLECNSYVLMDLPRDAELREAISQLKSEYREQYNELKCVHNWFIAHVTILVTIVSLIIPLLSWLEKREFQKEFETTKSQLREAQESNQELKRSEALGCLATAKFTWHLLGHEMKRGFVQGYRIAEPLYWICDALKKASAMRDREIMSACVDSVTKTIAAYNAVVKLHEGQHEEFKAFVVDNRFLADLAACDLSWFFEPKDKDCEKVLSFFNGFGIKMFGEAS